jgi:nucleotide-binding universal stress UspA family protein
MLKNVLIPVDGSVTATAALDCAVRTVGTEARFVVAEAIDPVDRISGMRAAAFDPELVRTALESLRDDARRHLAEAEARLRGAGVGEVETVVLEGRAGEAVVAYAAGGSFDLVVMGTHGRSGITRAIMGSVAEYVVRNLRKTPVLLVHPESTQPGAV